METYCVTFIAVTGASMTCCAWCAALLQSTAVPWWLSACQVQDRDYSWRLDPVYELQRYTCAAKLTQALPYGWDVSRDRGESLGTLASAVFSPRRSFSRR